MPPHAALQHRTRLATLLLPLALLAAACGSDDDEADRPDERGPEQSQTSATPGEDTTTTVAASGPREWVEVVTDLYERDFELVAQPDLDRVADVYAETCTCWDDQFRTVEFLAEQGHHIEGQPLSILLVRHEQTDVETGLEDLTVQVQASALQRVDAEGNVIEDIPTDGEPTCHALSLFRDGPDDAYRIYSQTPLPACPEA